MTSIPATLNLPIGAVLGGAFGREILQMVLHAGLMVQFVLSVLLLFSIISWAIIFMKLRMLRKAKQETDGFLRLFWESTELKKIHSASEGLKFSPVARLFKTGYDEFGRIQRIQSSTADPQEKTTPAQPPGTQPAVMDHLERSLKRATIDQAGRLEKAVSFLATAGNTCPFIGLFGTVWGIMESFRGIGVTGSANLAVVAPGISEALVATAAGLAAAIPAVVAFNYFSQKISTLRAEMDMFTSDFLSIVERQLLRRQMSSRTGA